MLCHAGPCSPVCPLMGRALTAAVHETAFTGHSTQAAQLSPLPASPSPNTNSAHPRLWVLCLP